ncbi:hypothetical protein N8I77_002958 [Diaporthe amygdali]|uniref:Cell wall protein PhiA n=1 Tax=Phomopsis amygdali TaxID=1214568 RepID=A0AAD9W768_PHOAM|nr:cell wall protein [Diaporthe amygdali]KAJ0116647.1 cell wall protein [Diaporthe amygdali]KAK2609461.1 hypothetical protein N8I77_002958 [Diaporthe amygdali]
MKFQVLSAATMVASAAAFPALHARQNGTVPDGTPFSLVSIRSGSDLQYASFSAVQGGLALNVEEQGATCEKGEQNYATFVLNQGELSLYTPANVTQTLYTDRSGMGQGVLQYSTQPGGYLPGRNSETKGWTVDQYGDLTFDGASLIACPTDVGSAYSVWVSAGVTNPGGNTDCVGVAVRTSVSTDPNACTYTYTPATSS